METVEDFLAVVPPVILVFRCDKIARARPVALRDLSEEMLGMQPHLFVRLPKLGQPEAENRGEKRPGVETDLKGRGQS